MERSEKQKKSFTMDEIIFGFMDQCKFLFFPEQWNQVFLDFSKNEVFVLLLVYRRKQVNMTEIAEYLNVPLNTVTGVVTRLEKKEMVLRERCKEDKRVVTLSLTEQGSQFLKDEVRLFTEYYSKIMESFSAEEKTLIFNLVERAFKVLSQGTLAIQEDKKPQKYIKRIIIE